MKGRAFKFGPFELDSERVELRRRGIRLRIPPSRFRLLLLFVTRPGELVTRDQIAACLWKEGQNVDVMSGINTAVKQLRSHLGDDTSTPNYIETVTGAGYRFIARVVEFHDPPEPAKEPLQPPQPVAAVNSPPLDAPSLQVPPTPALPVRRGFAVRIAMAAVVVAPASILLYWLAVSSIARKAPRPELELVHATTTGDIRSADISPDGKLIAYVRENAGRQTLWVKQLATDRVLQFDDLNGDRCPGIAFSPDGSYVYFVRKPELSPNGVLYRVPFLGGNPVEILESISGEPAISPDGKHVAFIRSTLATHGEDSVVTAGVDGSGERTLASYGAPGIYFNRITWTPDGKYLVFPLESHLMLLPADGGAAVPVPGDAWSSIDDLGALPPGRNLVVVGQIKGALRPQIFTVSLSDGEIQQVTHDLSQYVSVRASADGKALLAVQNLFLSSVQVLVPGSKSEVLTLSPENQARNGVDGLAWTPAGKIVYGSQSDLRGEFREMDSDGANQRLLGENALLGFSQLSVSPGGDFIAITRWLENDRSNIWRMDMSGQNPRQLTSGKQDFPPSITPDGKWVVYGSIQGDRSVLMKVSSQGGAPIQLTDYQADSPSVSPDGKWIACSTVSSSDKSPSLAVIPISGGAPTKLVELPGTVSPPPFAWSPDSREVAFINYPDGVGNVYEQPLDGGPAVPLTHFASGRIFNFQWSRQGRIVLSRGSETVDAVLLRNFRP